MHQPSIDNPTPESRPEATKPRWIDSNRQGNLGVVTEFDCSREFPISRVRWRPSDTGPGG